MATGNFARTAVPAARGRVLQYPLGFGERLTRVLETRGSGGPCVLLHGAGARADRWRSGVEVLGARGIRALALDLPGHGFASKGGGIDYSVAGLASFVGGALDELGISEATLIASSLGAHVAARLAIDRCGFATKLVLVGPTGLLPLGQEMRNSIAANLRNQTMEGVRRKLARAVADARAVDEDWLVEEFRINNSPGAHESFEQLARYVETRLDDDSVAGDLRQGGSGCPLMVVWGANDIAVPIGTPEDVERACGRAVVALVPDAGHIPYVENTEGFWRCVLPFVEE